MMADLVKKLRISNEKIKLCHLGQSVDPTRNSADSEQEQEPSCMKFQDIISKNGKTCLAITKIVK